MFHPVISRLVWSVLFPYVLAAVQPAEGVDKSRNSLVNPTPSGQLREPASDRPDFTESPSTVDAGHAQLEMD